eukprot:CAMPEP_0197061542 /NCGR_PEP_ID=MMETSP1384-20130603/137407_1 /TAXON_ID=29189 /ORGANISM="Ammonia sp." /LENGTH=51 /DNA_ID=CAMNT_0042497213 /DNA_START=36 /DNA_END=188 /DNA_ORIENTATION=-
MEETEAEAHATGIAIYAIDASCAKQEICDQSEPQTTATVAGRDSLPCTVQE